MIRVVIVVVTFILSVLFSKVSAQKTNSAAHTTESYKQFNSCLFNRSIFDVKKKLIYKNPIEMISNTHSMQEK